MVQVTQGPDRQQEAPRLSTQLSIRPAGLLVYLPTDPHIGDIAAHRDEAGRAALRDRLKGLLQPARRAASSCARSPKTRRRASLRVDIDYLRQHVARHPRALARGRSAPPPALSGPVARERVLRDMVSPRPTAVLIDSRETLAAAAAAFARPTCRTRRKLEHYRRRQAAVRPAQCRAGDRKGAFAAASTSSPAARW
jgi:ribonuclease G